MENAAPDARRDLEKFFEHLVPEGTPYYQHNDEGDDDMPSHIRMVLTRTSEVIPIAQRANATRDMAGNFPLRTSARSTHAENRRYGDGRIVIAAAACSRKRSELAILY